MATETVELASDHASTTHEVCFYS